MSEPSIRAQVVTRRTYSRPKDAEGKAFETWAETIDRVIGHQRWLWERAADRQLLDHELAELEELRNLMLERKVLPSGRTLWLGGTDIAKTRESSMFNCSASISKTVFDVVDHLWLLLQGAGVGSMAVRGVLNGFSKPVSTIDIIRSEITLEQWSAGIRGHDKNKEKHFTDKDGNRVWQLTVGDSAEAWAKSLGKILAMKRPVDKIILDFSQIRPAGIRLKGYGWISSGDEKIAQAYKAICELMSKRADQLLTRLDILDIENWIGTILSSRRSAEIILCPYGDEEWEEFAMAKKEYYIKNPHREQSNNSLVFYSRPSKAELYGIFSLMQMAGGSEPGFINAEAAKKRAPWFVLCNPCAEILLGDKNFCNLFEIVTSKFNGSVDSLYRGIYLAARANYRQTCVNLKDGVLSDSWHELNEYLRLCGVGLTGLMQWEHRDSVEHLSKLRVLAKGGACGMADELGLPRPKNVTTIKPSGSLSKISDCTEGLHKPLGKYILNVIKFSRHDPIVDTLREANYRLFDHVTDPSSVLIVFPVCYDGVEFEDVEIPGRGIVPLNREPAVTQLERYKFFMEHYVDQNASNTISYSPEEVPAIVDWIYDNWDSYVGVSFLYRTDPTKTAEDLGYPYLPQSVCTKEEYEAYVSQLLPVTLDDSTNTFEEIQSEECAGGVCPVR
jgi:ribonucleoside-triphosphate reductase (formate)